MLELGSSSIFLNNYSPGKVERTKNDDDAEEEFSEERTLSASAIISSSSSLTHPNADLATD
eukprot:7992123-Ditylum_brightwellii.AAC.1